MLVCAPTCFLHITENCCVCVCAHKQGTEVSECTGVKHRQGENPAAPVLMSPRITLTTPWILSLTFKLLIWAHTTPPCQKEGKKVCLSLQPRWRNLEGGIITMIAVQLSCCPHCDGSQGTQPWTWTWTLLAHILLRALCSRYHHSSHFTCPRQRTTTQTPKIWLQGVCSNHSACIYRKSRGWPSVHKALTVAGFFASSSFPVVLSPNLSVHVEISIYKVTSGSSRFHLWPLPSQNTLSGHEVLSFPFPSFPQKPPSLTKEEE